RWVVKLSCYNFVVRHKEGKSNPSDFLSRFPWDKIPAEVEEEVLYISLGDYDKFKTRIADAETRMQSGEGNDQQERLIDKFQVKQNRVYFKEGNKLILYPTLTEIKEAIIKIHNERHQNTFSTFKTLSSYYYAPGAYPVVKEIVGCCERCQRNNFSVRRSENFHGTQAIVPFQIWRIDVAGSMPATEKYKNKYVILAVDYFTKWPVALAVPEINAGVIIAFMCENIIAYFGVPRVLIRDRGTHLSNEIVASYNRYLGINHRPVTSYRPQANALRNSNHRTLGKTPAEIVYGLELLTPSIWEDQPIQIDEESIKAAYNAGVKSKNIEAQYYNKKVRPRFFEIGDQVLKTLAEPYTALGDRSVGSFEISAVLGDGVYEITDLKGNSDNVHSDRLTKYTSARGMVPVVRTGQARSTLPAFVRLFRGKVHEDVVL
ncbi:Pol polyprotein, partial [Smittium mucronatum]